MGRSEVGPASAGAVARACFEVASGGIEKPKAETLIEEAFRRREEQVSSPLQPAASSKLRPGAAARLSVATTTRLYPVYFCWLLCKAREGVEGAEEECGSLASLFLENVARNVFLEAELERALSLLGEAGIEAFPLKGFAVARLLYGEASLRHLSDLDILVSPGEFRRAASELGKLGYSFPSGLEPSWLLETAPYFAFPMTRTEEGKQVCIDLHWQPAPRDLFEFEADFFYPVVSRRADPAGAGATAALLLALLQLHHEGYKLRSLVEAASLLARLGNEVEMERLEMVVRSAGAGRVVAVAARLCAGLGLPWPLRPWCRAPRILFFWARDNLAGRSRFPGGVRALGADSPERRLRAIVQRVFPGVQVVRLRRAAQGAPIIPLPLAYLLRPVAIFLRAALALLGAMVGRKRWL